MKHKNSVTERMFDYLTFHNAISNFRLSLQQQHFENLIFIFKKHIPIVFLIQTETNVWSIWSNTT
jgi:hypothetical protein